MVLFMPLLDSLNVCSCGYKMKSEDKFCSSCGKKRYHLFNLSAGSDVNKPSDTEENSEFLMKKAKNMNKITLWYQYGKSGW